MLNRIKELELTLENCEIVSIPGKYIGDFCVRDIRKEVSRCAVNAIIERDLCYDFFCDIHPDANWGGAFDRLMQWPDITQIDFSLVTDDVWFGLEEENDGNSQKYHFTLAWGGDDSESNPRQKTVLSAPGWLFIGVNDKSREEFVASLGDDIDKGEYADFLSEWYEVGDADWEYARGQHIWAAENWKEKEDER